MTWHLTCLLVGVNAHILHKSCIHSRTLYSTLRKIIVYEIIIVTRCSRFKEMLWRQPPAKLYLAELFLT